MRLVCAMKARGLLVALAAGLALIGAASMPASPRFIWNRTESLPPGLYVVAPDAHLEHTDIAAYAPTPDEAFFLEARGYTGSGWVLVKRIAGLEGDLVCRHGQTIEINGAPTAKALIADAAGRSLPVWSGCVTLRADEVFLLADHKRSIDGRYLGVQPRGRLLGQACLFLPVNGASPTPAKAAQGACRKE